jgi:DNA-binding MarR family transcriptional regulator
MAEPTDPFDLSGEPIARRVTTGLAKIGLAARSRAWQAAGGQGLTPTQGQILALARARPGGVRPSDLAAALGVTPATITDALAALERKGLVERVRATDDGRARSVHLTDRGLQEAEAAAGWADFLLDAVDAMTPAEQAVFLRGLMKMIRTLQLRNQIPVQRMCSTCRYFQPHRHPDADRPHHCGFVDAPFGDRNLRLDCPDHDPAGVADAAEIWEAFVGDGPV